MTASSVIQHLLVTNPNGVWVVLMKSGLELVSRIESAPVDRFLLVKPMQVRTINVPMQNGTNIHINTQPQLQPFAWYIQAKEIPFLAEDVWHVTEAPKKVADAYIEHTTGIVTA